MSRNKKRPRKVKQQKQRRQKPAKQRAGAPRWLDVCDRAEALLNGGQPLAARKMLEEYDSHHRGSIEVLRLLLEVYHRQGDYLPYCRVCRRLVELEPANPALHLMLAGGYLNAARPASALWGFRRFLELWPNDPLAEGARETIAQIEPALDEMLSRSPFADHERVELAALHEEVLVCLFEGDFARAIRFGEQLLDRQPDFIPAMNNLSDAYFHIGKTDKAIALSRRALEIAPDNLYALASLTRYLYLTGQHDEAARCCDRLRTTDAKDDDGRCRKAETWSFVGDDEAVLAAFEEARSAGALEAKSPATVLLYHLAAVASARHGDWRQATRYWRKSLAIKPEFDLAKANLEDAGREVDERNGPWYLPLSSWIAGPSLDELRRLFTRPASRKSEEAVAQAARSFAHAHPEFIHLVPALLDRGDPAAREVASRLAMILETPEMLDALRTFCLSQRGPDAMRIDTADYLSRRGAMPSSKVRMWLRGQWEEILTRSYEITSEPIDTGRSDQVQEWMYDGFQALRHGDAEESERLFRKCLDIEGDAPDLLNNLAASYSVQGRIDEAHQLIRSIHERWPDYFFGQIGMANIALAAGDLETAKRYLEPLLEQQRLHCTEFSALATANVRLLLLKGEVEGAQYWLDMWADVDPDDPNLEMMESLVRRATLIPRALRALGRLCGRKQ